MKQVLVQFLVKELRAHMARGLYSYVLKLESWLRPRLMASYLNATNG